MAEEAQEIVLDLTLRSATGRSVLQDAGALDKDPRVYEAAADTIQAALRALESLGFKPVAPPSRFGLSIAGSPALVERVFGTGELTVPSDLAPYLERVQVPRRGEFYQP